MTAALALPTLDVDELPEAPADTAALERYDAGAALAGMSPTRQAVSMLSQLTELAARLAGTEFVPKALRGKPAAVLACILTGQELGVGPMQSLAHIHVIEGKPTQSAELMRALVTKAGHRFSVRKLSSAEVTVVGTRSDTGEALEVTWTLEDAKRAGVATKDVWRQYPRAMLLARATSELCRAHFADVLGGVSYTPDELGADVYIDPHDGRMILDGDVVGEGPDDASGAALAAGGPMGWAEAADYVETLRPREVMEQLKARGADVAGRAPELKARLTELLATDPNADPAPAGDADEEPDAELEAANAAMRDRLAALPDEVAAALRAWWPDSNLPSIAKHTLTAEQLDRLDRKVTALEASAAQSPQEAADGDDGPEGAADPAIPAHGPRSGPSGDDHEVIDAELVDDDDPGHHTDPGHVPTAAELDKVCEGCARTQDELIKAGAGILTPGDDRLPYCADCLPF